MVSAAVMVKNGATGYIQNAVDRRIRPIPHTNPSVPISDCDPDVCLDAGK